MPPATHHTLHAGPDEERGDGDHGGQLSRTGRCPAKVQAGTAWWFNDQLDGMRDQMTQLAQMGLISTFTGMLTDKPLVPLPSRATNISAGFCAPWWGAGWRRATCPTMPIGSTRWSPTSATAMPDGGFSTRHEFGGSFRRAALYRVRRANPTVTPSSPGRLSRRAGRALAAGRRAFWPRRV